VVNVKAQKAQVLGVKVPEIFAAG